MEETSNTSSIMKQEHNQSTFLGRTARTTARNPWKCLFGALVGATTLSIIGIVVGGFSIEVDNKGWRSRGTPVSDSEMQAEVLNLNRQKLFEDKDGSFWQDLEDNTSEGYVDLEERDDSYERKLMGMKEHNDRKNGITSRFDPLQSAKDSFRKLMSKRTIQRSNQKERDTSNKFRNLALSDTCDVSWYDDYGSILGDDNVFAVWKVQPALDADLTTLSALDKQVMSQICVAEMNTLKIMQDAKACKTCSDGKCLPPLSLILLLRNKLNDHESSCEGLMDAYTSEVQEAFTSELVICTNEYVDNFDTTSLSPGDTLSCPANFQPSLVDYYFGQEGNTKLRTTSSYFNTYVNTSLEGNAKREADLYDVFRDFDGADGTTVKGVYDTTYEAFNIIYVDALVISDMRLAVASLGITFTAMMIHTRSPWLTLLGVLQVIYAIPLAYFVYTFIAGLTFFPFLNFIGVFVSAALGADDLFVAVDKFKNARIRNRNGSTEDIAEIALPDAAGAMLLTTSTTMVAFFATCICPVPPILCFAVYCGLMILFNYVMNIFLVFPALCIYDNWLQHGSTNWLVAIAPKKAIIEDDIEDLEIEDSGHEKPLKLSLIHRGLSGYYNFLHKFRWFILVASLVATGVCVWLALGLPIPDNTQVRLLPEGHPLELHFVWQSALLSASIFSTGSSVQVIFGLVPGDTGTQNNPDTLSKLLLDKDFKPNEQASQEYLKGFCDDFFYLDFNTKPYAEYECAINTFDAWIGEQSTSMVPETVYTENCNGASAVPLPDSDFDKCIIAWSQEFSNRDILHKNGIVKIIVVDAVSSIDFASSIPEIDEEFNKYQAFLIAQKKDAPAGAKGFIHASSMWWWFDTNQQMLSTAIGAAGIAIAFSAVVVLFSSRSLLLTLFSGVCIIYVLAAATATLVGMGWELGFLESVCFAILVGISCDFVIHFGHAYINFKGHVENHERTKYAVLHMGPSILAAALTTLSAAVVMLFCKVVFFTKFAMILLVTILHATIGSFVVYIVLCDLFGPAEPTKLIDRLLKCGKDDVSKGTGGGDLVLTKENANGVVDLSDIIEDTKVHENEVEMAIPENKDAISAK